LFGLLTCASVPFYVQQVPGGTGIPAFSSGAPRPAAVLLVPGAGTLAAQRHRLGILTVLEEAGMVELDKGYAGRRPRTWVRMTGHGRKALARELGTLTELVRRLEAGG
jgi:hypothetical protein